MASPKNAKVSGYADVVINSLTKYANWEGDVMMGSAVFPKARPWVGNKKKSSEYSTQPFTRDIKEPRSKYLFTIISLIKRTSRRKRLSIFCRTSKGKKSLLGLPESTGSNYSSIAGEHKPGCVVSFEVDGCFKGFYDNLDLLKSPEVLGLNFHFVVLTSILHTIT